MKKIYTLSFLVALCFMVNVTRGQIFNTWTGGTSISWSTASNWSLNAVPGSADNVIIPSGTIFSPYNASGGTISSLIINSGATYNNGSFSFTVLNSLSNSGTLTTSGVSTFVQGDLTNTGTINGNGIKLNGSVAQTINGKGSITKLTINNSNGVTISSDTTSITSLLTLQSGTLTTGGNLILVSTAGGSASVAAIDGTINTGSISGNVTIQQYLSARRGWRMLGNPLSTPVEPFQFALNSNLSGFDLFKDAYDYDPSFNPTGGWTTNSGIWLEGGTLLLFIRGAGTEGIGGNYSGGGPSNVTLRITGAINAGNITNTLNTWNGTISSTEPTKFSLIANPYPSPVSLRSILGSTDSYATEFYTQTGSYSSTIHYYDPSLGQSDVKVSAGGYQSVDLASADFILPAFSSFFIEAVNTTPALGVRFVESGKQTIATSLTTFGNDKDDRLILNVSNSNGVNYDSWYLRYDNKSQNNSTDNRDGTKMSNSVFNLYSIATDKVHLSNDSRNASGTESVLLGLTTTAKQQYVITVSHNGVAGKYLYLKDNLLHTLTKLTEGANYSFDVTADNATQGEQRFEVVQQAPAIIAPLPTAAIKVSISPNPVSDVLNITSTGNTTIRITNVLGQVVRTIITADQNIKIPVSGLNKGLYIVEVSNDTERVTEKIIKN